MTISENSVTAQDASSTIELTWYEDVYTTMVLPEGTFSFAQGATVYYNWESGDFPQFFSRLYLYNLFSGNADQGDIGDYTFVISATTDSNTYEYATIHLTVLNSNDAPTLLYGGISDQAIEAGSAFSFTDTPFYFRDQDGDTLTYSATLSDGSDLPDWLSFDTATGAFSGTPARADVGTISVKVTATDPSNATRSDIFDITISAPPNTAPTGSPTAVLPHGTEDTAYVVGLASLLEGFTDADRDTLEIVNIVAKQGGIDLTTLTTKSGNLKITPYENSDAVIWITYTVSDGNGGTINAKHKIQVDSVDDPAIVANPVANQIATEDSNFVLRLPSNYFSDVDNLFLHVQAKAIVDGNVVQLPDWLEFRANGDGGGTFSGTPKNADVGPIKILLSAGGATDDFVINVKNTNDAPVIQVVDTLKIVKSDVEISTIVTSFKIDDDDYRDGIKILIKGISLSIPAAKSADELTGAEKNMLKIQKSVVDGETVYELVTTKKTDDILDDAGKKFTVTLEATDKAGATDEIDLTFKIKHVPAAAQGEHAFYAIEAADPVPHGHDWSL